MSELKEAQRLRELPKLIILDLVGNTLCNLDDYRLYLIFNVRKLKVGLTEHKQSCVTLTRRRWPPLLPVCQQQSLDAVGHYPALSPTSTCRHTDSAPALSRGASICSTAVWPMFDAGRSPGAGRLHH